MVLALHWVASPFNFGQHNGRSNFSPKFYGHFTPHCGQKLPQNGQNWLYLAKSNPGASRLADQGGSRLHLGWIHPGWCVWAFLRVRELLLGLWNSPKIAKIFGHKWPWSSFFGPKPIFSRCHPNFLTRYQKGKVLVLNTLRGGRPQRPIFGPKIFIFYATPI